MPRNYQHEDQEHSSIHPSIYFVQGPINNDGTQNQNKSNDEPVDGDCEEGVVNNHGPRRGGRAEEG